MSAEAEQFIQSLPASAREQVFGEVSDFGTILLESEKPLSVRDAEAAWFELSGPARARGWSCFLTSHSFQDVEPKRGDLEKSLEAMTKGTLQTWLEKRRAAWAESEGDEDEQDEGEETNTVVGREVALANVTEKELKKLREQVSAKPNLSQAGKKLHLGFVRGSPKWASLLYQFGGWNDAPMPEIQAQVLDRWHGRHGAELIALGHGTLQLYIEAPLSLEGVRSAAMETCFFCSESESYRDDLATVAGRVWFFWWD